MIRYQKERFKFIKIFWIKDYFRHLNGQKRIKKRLNSVNCRNIRNTYMNIEFKELTRNDLPLIKEIYDYYILTSTATFHTAEITMEELLESLPLNHVRYTSYLIRTGTRVCGYCYLNRYKKRQAYDRTAEITVYLRPEFFGRGIGRKAIERLEQDAEDAGIKVLIAVISADNVQSIKLFEKTGFEKCAHFKQVGEKFGKILDVVAYQKIRGN